MHQPVRELAVRGEQQQAGRRDVQATDGYPSAGIGRRQARKHRAPTLRVAPRGHFVERLVIDEKLMALRLGGDRRLQVYGLAVEPNVIARSRPVSELSRTAIHAEATGANPFLDSAAGAQPRFRQQLLQPRRHVVHIVRTSRYISAPGFGLRGSPRSP